MVALESGIRNGSEANEPNELRALAQQTVGSDSQRRSAVARGTTVALGGRRTVKRIAISFIAAFALLGQPFAQETYSVRVYGAGALASLDAQHELTLKFWLQQLMLSALYRDGVQDSSLDAWQRSLETPTRIHVRYPNIVSLAIPERRELSFNEALLPLPSNKHPDYIFIKRGQTVQRLVKYDPWVLGKLLTEAKLPVYEDLPAVERALF